MSILALFDSNLCMLLFKNNANKKTEKNKKASFNTNSKQGSLYPCDPRGYGGPDSRFQSLRLKKFTRIATR